MTVIGAAHREWAAPQLAGRCDHVFCEPGPRDTAMALYVALAMIRRWHPNAIVTVAPTGYVAPASRYLAAIAEARDIAARIGDLVVLLGVSPADPDPDLEYIVLGPAVSGASGAHGVRAFVDKPTSAGATELRDGGALSSMTVVCGSVAALWELGRAAEPQLIDILDSLVPLIGTEDEADAIDYIYRTRLPVSFARDICERAPQRIAALPITGIEWSDLSTPERMERVKAMVSR